MNWTWYTVGIIVIILVIIIIIVARGKKRITDTTVQVVIDPDHTDEYTVKFNNETTHYSKGDSPKQWATGPYTLIFETTQKNDVRITVYKGPQTLSSKLY